MSEPQRRLFFALEPPQSVRRQIDAVKAECAGSNAGRAVPGENLHLTLLFIGHTQLPLQQMMDVADRLKAVPFALQLDCFGHWKRPQALWLGPQITPVPLLALHAGVETAMKRCCGFEPETRPFRPHVTLMRKVRHVTALPNVSPIHWFVDGFSLMESRSVGTGVVYQPLMHWSFGVT